METSSSTKQPPHEVEEEEKEVNSEELPEKLSKSFVHQSLRRRLWKACQEDDVELAMKIYNATQHDFEAWLLKEEEDRKSSAAAAASAAERGQAAGEASSSFTPQHGSKDKRGLRKKQAKAKLSSTEKDDAHSFKSVVAHDSFGSGVSCRKHALTSPSLREVAPRSRSTSEAMLGANRNSFSGISSNRLLRSDSFDVQSQSTLAQSCADSQLSDIYGAPLSPVLPSALPPSESFIPDDWISPNDSCEYQSPNQSSGSPKTRRRSSRKSTSSALAFFRGSRSSQNKTEGEMIDHDTTGDQKESAFSASEEALTTPLHEAARLGSYAFVQTLLDWGADPNVKNGVSRTALHMLAGGLTVAETRLVGAAEKYVAEQYLHISTVNSQSVGSDDAPHSNSDQEDLVRDPIVDRHLLVGIRAPIIPTPERADSQVDSGNGYQNRGTAKFWRRSVTRLIKSAFRSGKAERPVSKAPQPLPSEEMAIVPDPHRLGKLKTQRMEATVAVLSWTHPQTGDGLSINAVDVMGRTALHYAAELGRDDVCMAILSKFDAILTIVDELGATPCELAAEQGHPDLAAQLEARAILYYDPYGADDDMMAAVLATSAENDPDGYSLEQKNHRSSLVPPFNWFETLSMEQVGQERLKRLKLATIKMKEAAQRWHCTIDKKSSAGPSDMATAAMPNNGDRNNSPMEEMGKDRVHTVEGHDKSENEIFESFSQLQETHVERFLLYHKWNVSAAMEIFRKDPFNPFKEAGVPVPWASHLKYRASRKMDEVKDTSYQVITSQPGTCHICYDDVVETNEWIELEGCDHGFCAQCLREYVSDCAASKSRATFIPCPHHECDVPLSLSEISTLLNSTPHVFANLTAVAVENFVTTSFDLRFCPHPGCSGVVRRKDRTITAAGLDFEFLDFVGAVCTIHPVGASPPGAPIPVAPSPSAALPPQGTSMTNTDTRGSRSDLRLTYDGIRDPEYFNCRSSQHPRKAHRFCFSCGEGVHWPVTCQRLEDWKQKVREEIEGLDDGQPNEHAGRNVDELAQKLWIKANTRPCPQCKVAIEKSDGCNHMTCTNPVCRHEFCWICRKDWKLHGTATGGFFRCNIWQDPDSGQETSGASTNEDGRLISRESNETLDANSEENPDQGYGTAIHSSRSQWKQKQLMARFLHHYTRWNAHAESASLEGKMGASVCSRLAPVVEAACKDVMYDANFNFGGKGLSFIHSAFIELLECRAVLQQSYALSFFRYPAFRSYRWYGRYRREEKTEFERLQSELEAVTEQMSDIVARSHIRATQIQINLLTVEAAQRRMEFCTLIFKVLREERNEKQQKESESNHRKHENTHTRRQNFVLPEHAFDHIERIADVGVEDLQDENYIHEMMRSFGDFPGHAIRGPWSCSVCTLMNNDGGRCDACGNLR